VNTSWSGKRTAFPTRIRRYLLTRQPECAAPTCTRPSEIADHIVNHPNALRAGWTLDQYHSPDNGQALCRSCHDRKTRAEQAEGRQRKRARLGRPAVRHPGELTVGGDPQP